MGNKKYQIFVSSTYEDLKEERNIIIEHILTLGHMPVGMELFCASNDEQFEYIKKIIDDCDYYVLILGGRYGSISDKTGLSYTEMEYRYAVEKNIPVLIFPYQNINELPSDKKDKNTDAISKFRDEVSKNRVVKFWMTHSDLTAGVLVALTKQFQENPQQGWQRFEDHSELVAENRILRKEKDELLQNNNNLRQKTKETNPNFTDIIDMNEEIPVKYTAYYYHLGNKIGTKHLSLDEIFLYIAYDLRKAQWESKFEKLLIEVLNAKIGDSNIIEIKSIEKESYESIIITLKAHKLINTGLSGSSTYFQLSDFGESYLESKKVIRKKTKSNV